MKLALRFKARLELYRKILPLKKKNKLKTKARRIALCWAVKHSRAGNTQTG